MKTLNDAESIRVNNNVSLDGFIVKETLAKEELKHNRVYRPMVKTVFTLAELRRIQNRRKK
ncbi:MAG: hypothetical protein EPN39_19265 [Chitinophagaceae bacterium]|jgi:hypothetical protein|nr:MAG: hypothetical protein EPN39_19265 [Chitinophagaceae bacterium]